MCNMGESDEEGKIYGTHEREKERGGDSEEVRRREKGKITLNKKTYKKYFPLFFLSLGFFHHG